MATRDLRTPSVLLVNETLEERELYAHTLRAAGHRVIIPKDSGAVSTISCPANRVDALAMGSGALRSI